MFIDVNSPSTCVFPKEERLRFSQQFFLFLVGAFQIHFLVRVKYGRQTLRLNQTNQSHGKLRKMPMYSGICFGKCGLKTPVWPRYDHMISEFIPKRADSFMAKITSIFFSKTSSEEFQRYLADFSTIENMIEEHYMPMILWQQRGIKQKDMVWHGSSRSHHSSYGKCCQFSFGWPGKRWVVTEKLCIVLMGSLPLNTLWDPSPNFWGITCIRCARVLRWINHNRVVIGIWLCDEILTQFFQSCVCNQKNRYLFPMFPQKRPVFFVVTDDFFVWRRCRAFPTTWRLDFHDLLQSRYAAGFPCWTQPPRSASPMSSASLSPWRALYLNLNLSRASTDTSNSPGHQCIKLEKWKKGVQRFKKNSLMVNIAKQNRNNYEIYIDWFTRIFEIPKLLPNCCGFQP